MGMLKSIIIYDSSLTNLNSHRILNFIKERGCFDRIKIMNTKSILIKEIENLPATIIAEVPDYVYFLEYKSQKEHETYIQSESALSKDWNLPEEDEAWKNFLFQ